MVGMLGNGELLQSADRRTSLHISAQRKGTAVQVAVQARVGSHEAGIFMRTLQQERGSRLSGLTDQQDVINLLGYPYDLQVLLRFKGTERNIYGTSGNTGLQNANGRTRLQAGKHGRQARELRAGETGGLDEVPATAHIRNCRPARVAGNR